jgi:ribosomal protein S18 acetylase RimI-like enzyme
VNADGEIQLRLVDADTFDQFEQVLMLLRDAFAYMDDRIDPPSSLHRIDLPALIEKSRTESLIVALSSAEPVGCVFASEQQTGIYLGKLAVGAGYRGRGVARRLIARVESLAVACGKPCVELETRVELVENQRFFKHLGYQKSEENSHAGYNRVTSFRYKKQLLSHWEASGGQ